MPQVCSLGSLNPPYRAVQVIKSALFFDLLLERDFRRRAFYQIVEFIVSVIIEIVDADVEKEVLDFQVRDVREPPNRNFLCVRRSIVR